MDNVVAMLVIIQMIVQYNVMHKQLVMVMDNVTKTDSATVRTAIVAFIVELHQQIITPITEVAIAPIITPIITVMETTIIAPIMVVLIIMVEIIQVHPRCVLEFHQMIQRFVEDMEHVNQLINVFVIHLIKQVIGMDKHVVHVKVVILEQIVILSSALVY